MNEDGTRQCYLCQLDKPLEEFKKSCSTKRSGRSECRYHECFSCAADRGREYRLRSQYNISVEEYERILAEQGGVCAVCQKPPTTKRLAVDHDHKTGLVRGLVCWWCNRLIGAAKDDAGLLQSASQYLKEPPASRALGEPRYGRTGSVKKRKRKRSTTKKEKS